MAALLRERLEQILAGRGNTDQQIAAIFGLMYTIGTEVGFAARKPAVLAWLTLGVLSEECGDSRAPSVDFEQADQDACRVGAMSLEEYQAIAAEIASQPAIDWREVHRGIAGSEGEEAVEAALRDRIQEVMASRGSADQGIAAMHALMRSLGAEFMWTDLVRFSQRPSLRWAAVHHYRIDVNRLGVSRLWRPWGRIDIVFLTDDPPQTMGDLYQVTFHIPMPFSPNLSGRKEDLPQIRACPQIPAEAERPVHHQGPEQEGAELPSGGRHDG